ncbi:MAG: hypothetical protein QF560_17300 [SAR324 cluster bacterium]|jgi:hypothetical protein|uniref:Uncharacterized protein n=1 Tax=marine metagenome TaxID=408172 RepID=A0A382N2Y0_9ZZZZ|nr:hypothetical protein [SAR324 cluster bacterium]MEE1574603.1 hypothetical protein [Deltaproteobacteria bacterium]MDP6248810.1 hypothetical protein [SAR324 cluster bacterium]MDP6331101.1 hypothetical protein [SAR324 cluster bacterium]MDP6463033.1 hypothetical protein [SAR324 cluster bacterium]|tara:strand:- start:237 stop:413 length:177 start_codon:yes stop_codon:yes gene_type:complete
MNTELQQTALMLLGKACLHGLVTEEHLNQRLEDLSSTELAPAFSQEERVKALSCQIRS